MQATKAIDYKLRDGEVQFRIKNETITITMNNDGDYPQVFKCAIAKLINRKKDYNHISDAEKREKKIRKIFQAELAGACANQINQREGSESKNISPFPVWD
jgi:uncharacterized protein YajQ (UPF0234 family)